MLLFSIGRLHSQLNTKATKKGIGKTVNLALPSNSVIIIFLLKGKTFYAYCIVAEARWIHILRQQCS